MNATNLFSPTLLAAAVLAFGVATDAHAVALTRTDMQISTGLCDAVSPAQDTSLRRNATGIQNVSNTYVMIGCSMQGDFNSATGLLSTYAYFRNPTAANVTVRCTLSAGSQLLGFVNSSKSIVVAPGGLGAISWSSPADFPAGNRFSNMSCYLPPSVVAGEIVTRYLENVGA